MQKMQELLMVSREGLYQQNEAEVRKRWNFEDAVSFSERCFIEVEETLMLSIKINRTYIFGNEINTFIQQGCVKLIKMTVKAFTLLQNFYFK